jgi:hypothetical protein
MSRSAPRQHQLPCSPFLGPRLVTPPPAAGALDFLAPSTLVLVAANVRSKWVVLGGDEEVEEKYLCQHVFSLRSSRATARHGGHEFAERFLPRSLVVLINLFTRVFSPVGLLGFDLCVEVV